MDNSRCLLVARHQKMGLLDEPHGLVNPSDETYGIGSAWFVDRRLFNLRTFLPNLSSSISISLSSRPRMKVEEADSIRFLLCHRRSLKLDSSDSFSAIDELR
ncbi:hypothetical protein PanWU01x14_050760 [Parasponia andersonii]|uniref:Uncharacterized protein n=1 Tax=Parasponia andersonii TaxID=3476 RepID=A0A2P5DLU7_PARAD|nr:hypothetical protein PanWU01x14_050760 [Parasponia andersonii]